MGNYANNQNQQYTDQENTWAAQMAYCNITEELLENILIDRGINEPTFAQIVQYCDQEKINLWYDGKENSNHDFLMNAGTAEYGNWNVVGICDTNRTSSSGTCSNRASTTGCATAGLYRVCASTRSNQEGKVSW